MVPNDLIQSFREFADDLKEPFLWPDDLVESYLARAEIEACERKPLLTSSIDTDMCQVAVTADTALYAKHIAVREIYYAKFTETTSGDTHKLAITNIDELYFKDPDWEDLEGSPVYLILDDTNIQFVPTPVVDGSLELSISHVPKVEMATSLALSIDRAHQYNLVYWMLHLGFERRDADTFNANKALDYAGRFTNYFGDPKGVNAIKSVRGVRNDRSRGGWI